MIETKTKIKKLPQTGGRYKLNGLKLAGKSALSVAETVSRGTKSVAKTRNERSLIVKGEIIAANVTFPAPKLAITSMKYAFGDTYLKHVDK